MADNDFNKFVISAFATLQTDVSAMREDMTEIKAEIASHQTMFRAAKWLVATCIAVIGVWFAYVAAYHPAEARQPTAITQAHTATHRGH